MPAVGERIEGPETCSVGSSSTPFLAKEPELGIDPARGLVCHEAKRPRESVQYSSSGGVVGSHAAPWRKSHE
jgi:hypothetical protein